MSRPESPAAEPDVLTRVAEALEKATCPGREGPFGLYNYSVYRSSLRPPHVIRDFRPGTPRERWGMPIVRTSDPVEALAIYETMTREFLAAEAIRAFLGGELPPEIEARLKRFETDDRLREISPLPPGFKGFEGDPNAEE